MTRDFPETESASFESLSTRVEPPSTKSAKARRC